MKKDSFTSFRMTKKIAVMALVLIGLVFIGCEKDKLTTNPEQQITVDNTLNKILNFKNLVENPQNIKSGEFMSVDSAVWYIEALLNYEYCVIEDSNQVFAETTLDSSFIQIKKTNEIDLFDVITSFNQFKTQILNKLKKIDNDFKRVSVVDISIKDNQFVAYYMFNFGEQSKVICPNISGDWHWGGLWNNGQLIPQGMCDWTYVFHRDAGTEINRVVRQCIPYPYKTYFTNVDYHMFCYNPADPYWYLFVRYDNPYEIWGPNGGYGENYSCFWYGWYDGTVLMYYPCIEQTELNWYKDATVYAINQIKSNIIPSGNSFKDFYFWGDGIAFPENEEVIYSHKLQVYWGVPHIYIPEQ